MLRIKIACILSLLSPHVVFAQNGYGSTDTLQPTQLEEIIIISQKAISQREAKPLTSLDDYLEKASTVNMIRRGNYALEPFINGMASERNVITIDGMRIYGACTDKMDPVTSYVEITNLAKANIHSGQSGSTGATVGGSLDLERKKGSFGKQTFKGMAFSGFETNNQQKILGAAISLINPRFFTDLDITMRDADNYKAGGGEEILYSPFTKYNISAMAGYKIGAHQHFEASLIYDHATGIGYPALPMDVSMARAFMVSAEYVQHHLSKKISQWQTKLYFNNVTHIMDDSKRPVVPIRMDMPGWSNTAGFYSNFQGNLAKHNWKLNTSGHLNRSLAEMTMYANSAEDKDMFMLTWPGVVTHYADIYVEDKYRISEKWTLGMSAGIALHNNLVDNPFGLESLRIFYPEMNKNKTRVLKRVSTSLAYKKKNWSYHFGAAYGERAPGVSEGYGFYLFNSFDRFDYIGNPNMNNEKAISASGGLSFQKNKFSGNLAASYFYLADYILAQPQAGFSAMTIGATGVKKYESLKYAQISNISLELTYQPTKQLLWVNKISYRRGLGENTGNLPMIQPFSYYSQCSFHRKTWGAALTFNGAAKQTNFNAGYGEQELPGYGIADMSISHRFKIEKNTLTLKAGIDNLFDTYYTTFADWNRLPRMGRNFYLNLLYRF